MRECWEAKVRLDGWCEGGLRQQRNDGEAVKAVRQCTKDQKAWRALVHMKLNEFQAAIFAWPCVLLDHPPVIWWLTGYHMERGGMPLHDAIGINCRKGATTENQGSAAKYMG